MAYRPLHFFVPGFAPLMTPDAEPQKLTVQEITYQLFNTKNMMTACDPRHGRYLASSVTYHGDAVANEMDESILKAYDSE